jgi:adenylosuccinate synthase
MAKASVVIGANYGDEGKGLMTDFLCRNKGADLVIRFNGGAQAGHTVVTSDGLRHVFSHFGSGTLAGIPTFLSKFFILNPIIFKKEYMQLNDIGINPISTVDPRCMLTTPWDMMWNQYLEEMRGNKKHGSCGVGIGATVDRYEKYGYLELNSIEKIWSFYRQLINNQTPSKDMRVIYDKYHDYFNDIGIYEAFIEDVAFMKGHTKDTETNPKFKYAVCEGAQGLALDKHMGHFPYVTRSNTGLRNVKALQWELGFKFDEIVYVTRSYLTRHGVGPFKEFAELPGQIKDDTNINNKWQDSIRFGPIEQTEWSDMQKRIDLDLASNGFMRSPSTVHIAKTHMDQYINCNILGAYYTSYGPTWQDVKTY